MSLKIAIDHSKLIDSPYSEPSKGVFDFTLSDTADFVHDIVNGNPTCYLVSGYRGAGKSSFIKKLEADVTSKDENCLFVYLNFAKHEERTILLRKLIRNFYLQFESNETLYNKISTNSQLQVAVTKFRELHERTFYEVSKNTNEKKSDTRSSSITFTTTIKDFIVLMAGIIAGLGIKLSNWLSWIIIPLPVLALFIYESQSKKQQESTDEVSKEMLYDDEIAEYYIIKIIESFTGHIKVVFVLDELDKISEVDLVESLINEMKPIMLSGLANFIVIAGQSMYYNYYLSLGKDDGSLSSLFSKVHHVGLLSPSELRVLFSKMTLVDMTTLSRNEQQIVDGFIDLLIFESKRIPRRFVLLIRQMLRWDGDSAYIEIEQTIDELNIYSKVLKNIENIDDKEISNRGYPNSIRDYFNMQLLLKAHRILRTKGTPFTQNSI